MLDRDQNAIQLYLPDGEMLSLLGWTAGVTRKVNLGCMHSLEAEYENHTTIATVSLLRANRA